MKISMILFITILAVFMSSVSPVLAADIPAGESKAAVTVTKSDSGKQISVREGEILEVRLELAAGTGYSWEIINLDKEHLKLLDSKSAPLKQGAVLGGPMLMTWRIKAVNKGQTELKAYLYRSWEGIEKAAETFLLRIDVQ
ncbi:MAG: protease inhibitor I42 family protein [Syntrophobacteraceae bacterium]